MVGHCESHYSGKAKSFKKSCQWFRAKDAQSAYSRSRADSLMDDGNAREERGAHQFGPGYYYDGESSPDHSKVDDGNAHEERGAYKVVPGQNVPFDRGKRGDEYIDQVSSHTSRDADSQQITIGDNRSSFQLVHQLLGRLSVKKGE